MTSRLLPRGYLLGLGRKSRRPARAPPGWNALETSIREWEATQPAGERSQSHIPHGPPPDSLSSRPAAQGLRQLCSHRQNLHRKLSHWSLEDQSPLGWGTAPRHSLAGQREMAGFRDRSWGSGMDGTGPAPRRKRSRPAVLPKTPEPPTLPTAPHTTFLPAPPLSTAQGQPARPLPTSLQHLPGPPPPRPVHPGSAHFFKCPLLGNGHRPLPVRASIPALLAHLQDWSPGAQP